MKAFSNYEETKTYVERPMLPVGAYPIIIKVAEEKTYPTKDGSDFSRFEISFDICDGEFKDFFADDYRAQTQEDKKWKGVLRQYLPKDDGSEKDEWTKRSFKTLITAIEESNAKFHWDWDEKKLKGLKVACLFRNEEWEYEGKTGWKAQPFKFISMEQFTKGEYKVPKDKPLANKPAPAEFQEISNLTDEDLPF
ncbi:hypothetical protein [Scatolibacter rhodanostii]|uniref:hypothetical protein n=1 Tax=Scatolibacter rhodanostii TaxID=2014781 RepID=UPI000C083EE3|nr:hypothetical protein [Scatolibacter rhodanostii]